ncbi:MAG: hypothetical protein KDC48_17165, partial [Planctomycetes bacterium]|nr:hypothetical protein [Planctomycetota bacterium]
SGDLGFRDQDGWITLVGRRDAQLKIGGYRVSPDEVTEVLRSVPGVATSAATTLRRGSDRLPALCVALVLRQGADMETVHERVVAMCRRELPSYLMPAEIHFVERLPLNANEKLDYLALRTMLEDRFPEFGA